MHVMVAIEQHEKGGCSGRHKHQAFFRECVRVQQAAAAALVSDEILHVLVCACHKCSSKYYHWE
jgi:hypothetical protein